MKAELFNDHFLTYEELVKKIESLPIHTDDKNLINQPIFQQAKDDPRCKFFLTGLVSRKPYIIITDPIFDTLDNKIGFMISLYPKELTVFEALAPSKHFYNDFIRDGFNLGSYPLDIDLKELIKKIVDSYGVCPECGRRVGPKNLHQVGFAGCCCADCLPAAKEKYEYPGWCN